MGYITDRNHLATQIADGINALHALGTAWLEEDHAACAPRSSGGGGPISGGGTSDPSESIATGRDMDDHEQGPPVDAAKYADRDRIGSELLALVGRLRQLVKDRQPRNTGGPCRCCETHTATHGRDGNDEPWACWPCFAYWRRWGFTCDRDSGGHPTDAVHRHRPEPPRFCGCPSWCCDECHDPAADGRSYSERCKRRMSPDRRGATG